MVESSHHRTRAERVVVIGCIIIIGLLVWSLWTGYQATTNRVEINTKQTAKLFGSAIERSLDDLAEVLYGMQDARLIFTRLETEQRAEAFADISKGIMQRKPHVRVLQAISPEGEILAWNLNGPRPNVSDRDYFRYHVDNYRTKLFVSGLLQSKLNDEPIIVASLAFRDGLGDVVAILAASIKPEYLTRQFKGVTDIDGIQLSIVTEKGAPIWSSVNNRQNFISAKAIQLDGNYCADSGINSNAFCHYYPLPQYPFIALASVPSEQALGGWKMEAAITSLAIALVILLGINVARRLLRDQKRMMASRDELTAMAMTDPMTNLANRRRLWDKTGEVLNKASKKGSSTALVVLDIDHFKQINDSYGHKVGDEVILAVADEIRANIGKSDIASRIGGEEFAVVVPLADMGHGEQLAKRLKKGIRSLAFRHEKSTFHITASFGVAEITSDLDDALIRADQAMYRAKELGRDRIVRADQITAGSHSKAARNDHITRSLSAG